MSGATFYPLRISAKDSIGYDRIPVKVMTIPGAIYNDYIHLQGMLGDRLARHPVDIARLYLAIHGFISGALREGVDMSSELATWGGALDLEPSAVRENVLCQIKPTRQSRELSALAAKAEKFVKGAWKTYVLRRSEWTHPNAASHIAAQKRDYLLQKAAMTTS